MDISIDIVEEPTSMNKPLALLKLIGEERSIVEFSKIANERISEEIKNIPTIEIARGFYTIPKWRSKSQEPKKLALNMGIKLDVLSVDEGWFEKTVYYEVEGKPEDLRAFAEKTSPEASS
jgi:hypothetical protein